MLPGFILTQMLPMKSPLAVIPLILGIIWTTSFSAPHGASWGVPIPPPPPAYSGPSAGPAPASTGGAGPPVASTPSPGSPSTPNSGTPSAPSTPGTLDTSGLTSWSYWWYFNREGLLDLRRRFADSKQITGNITSAPQPTRPSDAALTGTVLPSLLKLTSDLNQDNVRLSAGIALGRIGNPLSSDIQEALTNLMTERDPGLRENAALALGIQGEPDSIVALGTVLGGGKAAHKLLGYKPNSRMRAFAAYGLASLIRRAANDDIARVALAPIWLRFQDDSEGRDMRVALLTAMGMATIDFGTEVTEVPRGKHPVPRYRRDLISQLWQLYEDEADVYLRGHFPIALARLLQDAPNDLRSESIERLITRLDGRLKSLELHGIITSLGIIGQAWGQPADIHLRKTLYAQATTQKDQHGRHLALMALSEVVANSGPAAPPPPVIQECEAFLIERLAKGAKNDRVWVAMAAGSLGARLKAPGKGRHTSNLGEPLLAELRKIIKAAGSPDLLSASALALGLSEDLTSADQLVTLLGKSRNKGVQGYVALSLGLIGHTASYPELAVLIDQVRYDPVSLEHTAMGLALLDRGRATELLRSRLATAATGIIAAPLASALGRVSDGSSILHLAQLTKDKSATLATRENAGVALGLISDRDNISWRHYLAADVNYMAWTPTLFDSAGSGVLNIF